MHAALDEMKISKGLLKIGKEKVKVALFTDDLPCFVKNTSSYGQLTSSLKYFAAVSGIKVSNSEKTEFFCLGLKKLELFPHKFKRH